MMTLYGYTVASIYLVEPEYYMNGIVAERVAQLDGGYLWAIRKHHGNVCLNNEGEWEFEPSPSGRDEEFLKRCRFETIEDVLEAWNRRRGL